MAIILEAVAANGAVQRVPLADAATVVPAQPGLRYRLFNDAGGRVSPAALVKRVDGDLVVEGLADNKSVSLQGFFSRCTPQDTCSMSMENIGGTPDEAVTPATQPVATLPEGGLLMYASGMTASEVVAARDTEFSFKPLLGVAGGLAIVGAAGGGGGGSSGKSSDTTPPGAPVITSGEFTNKVRPTIAGTAEPGSKVTLTLDVGSDGKADVTYDTTVASNGIWSIDTATATPTTGSLPTIAEGVTTSLSARAVDGAGNPSALTTARLTLDTHAPPAPSIDSPLLTNDTTPVIYGFAEPGSIVTVELDLNRDGTADVRWNATADAAGAYSVDVGSAPASGTLPAGKLGDVSTTGLSVFASDLAGNASPRVPAELRVDTSIPPPPTIATIAGDNRINAAETGASVTISGTLDAAYADRPVSVQWGSLAPRAATVTGTVWSITIAAGDIPGDGVQTVRATYVNAAGTTSVEATQPVVIDRVAPGAPSIALNPVSDSGTLGDGITNDDTPTIRVTLTGTGAVAGDTITVRSGGATVATVAVSANDVSAGYADATTVSLGADGPKTLTATLTDLVGNVSSASASLAITIDRSAPTVIITDDTPGTATGPVTFTFTFSEPVNDFAASDIVVSGGTKGAFTAVSSTVYRLVVTPPADTNGQITVDVPAGIALDVAGTGNLAAAQAVQPYSLGIAPTLAITDNAPGTATGPVTFTFTFSEPVNGFTAADIGVTNGTKGAFTGANGDSVYTLVVTPAAGAAGDIGVSVAAGVATDLTGNPNVGPVSVSQPFDTAPPTLLITDNAPGTATGPVTFTFTFSEPVNDFAASDIVVSGGTKGAFTGANGSSVYTLVVNPPADTSGSIGVSVAAGAAADLSGNASVGPVSTSQAFDTAVAPTLTITDNAPGTATGPVTFTFTFSEPVNDFAASDIVVSGGTKGAFTGANGSSVYTLVVNPPADTSGSIGVSVAAGAAADLSGNVSVGPVSTSQAFDTAVAPTLTITDNAPGTATGPVTFTFTFSEPVNDFAASDIVVSGGTKGAFTGANGSSVYTLVVNPPADTSGSIGVSVAAGAAADLSGNASVGPVSTSQAFDTAVAPTLTITDNAPGTATGPVTFTFTFSEPVNDFAASDIVVSGGTKGAFTGANGSSVYTLVVNPPADTSGSIGVSVAAGAAADLSGNPSVGPVSTSQPFDTAVPTVTISQILDDVPPPGVPVAPNGTTDDNSPTLVLTLSELFTTGAQVEVFRNGGSVGLASPSGTTTVNFTDTVPSDSTYTYTARMTDAAGNIGGLSAPFTITIDTTP
ncbi:MAG: Ig-like domain-containing protein [Burkholderiaceae bacterium]|nr:Ig-like domain-containing protein [Burkholderiaceae bacterium]